MTPTKPKQPTKRQREIAKRVREDMCLKKFKKHDEVLLLQLERSIASWIDLELDALIGEVEYFRVDGLSRVMAKSAVEVLRLTSQSAEWGMNNL